MSTPTVATRARGRYVALTRSRRADDPELLDARRALAVAKVEARIQAAVQAAPPLPATVCDRLVELIRAAATSDGGK